MITNSDLDITDRMLKYRQCCLDIWNNHIRLGIDKPEHEFININASILYAFLAGTDAFFDLASGMTNILVTSNCPDMIMIQNGETSNWLIKEKLEFPNKLSGVFVDFFDFRNSSDIAEYKFVKFCCQKDCTIKYLCAPSAIKVQFTIGNEKLSFRE
jgi:hypothetical protein